MTADITTASRPESNSSGDAKRFVALTLTVTAVAIAMVLRGNASVLEAVSFVTGAIAVWLTVKENIWNFPIGLVNTAAYSVVFYQARLFGDAALQIVYFGLCLAGWYRWLYGGEQKTRLTVTRAGSAELSTVALLVAVCTLLLWKTLHFLGGSASFWDALTTSGSLGAQWLLNGKRLQNWHLWILVDIVYVPLYVSRGLHLTAILYAIFLALAVMGLRRWQRVWAASQPSGTSPGEPQSV